MGKQHKAYIVKLGTGELEHQQYICKIAGTYSETIMIQDAYLFCAEATAQMMADKANDNLNDFTKPARVVQLVMTEVES